MISKHLSIYKSLHIFTKGIVIPYSVLSVFVLVAVLALSVSCKKGESIQQENLYGKWDIKRADRNGKETPYLRGGYFIIEKTGSMTVNITGDDETGPFTLEDRTLTISQEKDFIIETLHPDSMTVRFTKGPENEFLFYLYKNVDETD